MFNLHKHNTFILYSYTEKLVFFLCKNSVIFQNNLPLVSIIHQFETELTEEVLQIAIFFGSKYTNFRYDFV